METELTKEDRSYYSNKMVENRKGWQSVGMRQVQVQIPDDAADYFRGLASYMTGKRLLDAVDNHDELAIETFSQRRPRTNFTDETLSDLRIAIDSSAEATQGRLLEELGVLDGLIAAYKVANREGVVAGKEGLPQRLAYWFAREYALIFMCRGLYDLIRARLANPLLSETIV